MSDTGQAKVDEVLAALAADRINDRAYVAAYEACMRQKGYRGG